MMSSHKWAGFIHAPHDAWPTLVMNADIFFLKMHMLKYGVKV